MIDVRARSDKLRDRAARIVATLTGCSRDEALAAVDEADGSAKTAIVMRRLNLTRSQAEARLAACDARLDKVFGES
jgi:N-acetylmuramic acid 6-phosphate etherase